MKFSVHLEIEQPAPAETVTIKTSDLVDLITENEDLKEENLSLKKRIMSLLKSKNEKATHLQRLLLERQLQQILQEELTKAARL